MRRRRLRGLAVSQRYPIPVARLGFQGQSGLSRGGIQPIALFLENAGEDNPAGWADEIGQTFSQHPVQDRGQNVGHQDIGLAAVGQARGGLRP